jgi:glycosyltransferase involved in cell wall biosynthesis
MISIIICSRDANALAAVSQSIAATINVPYELLAIDNGKGHYGICAAYNLGAAQAKYDLLCFMHEDLTFHTPNWGQIVADILADQSIGILGVAGGMYQARVPSGWWSVYEHLRMQVIQTTVQHPRSVDIVNPLQEELADVVAVDGLWFCSRREVWQQHKFDEVTFPAFHFYDLDYCTQVFQHLRVCVTFKVLIEHFSTGSVNDSWLLAALSYQRKWRDKLPFGVISLTSFQQKKIEQRVLSEYTERVIQSKLSMPIAVKAIVNLLALTQVSRESIGMLNRFVKKRLLRKKLTPLYK